MTPAPSPQRKQERALACAAARDIGLPLASGIYAQVTGPSYETPAEVRALRQCGADAVGMSTGRECEVAHELGLRCLGLSCITNRAAGLAGGPITHDEVTAMGRDRSEVMGSLLEAILVAACGLATFGK